MYSTDHNEIVPNFVVIGKAYFKLECYQFWSNFEFDRNIVNGTGAWTLFNIASSNSLSPDGIKLLP